MKLIFASLVLLAATNCGRQSGSKSSSVISDGDMIGQFKRFGALCASKDNPEYVTPEVKLTVEEILASVTRQKRAQQNLADDQELTAPVTCKLVDNESDSISEISFAWHGNITKIWPVHYFQTSLISLDVSGNPDIQDWSLLKKYAPPKLRVLNASSIALTDKEAASILAFNTLESLNLSHNGLTQLPIMKNMENLRFLDLSFNALTNIYNVSETKIESLNLASQTTRITAESLASGLIENGASIKYLDLSDNPTISNLKFVDHVPNLTSLILRNTDVSKLEKLAELKSLSYLDLSSTKVSDLDLVHIVDLPLEFLLLSENRSLREPTDLQNIRSLRALSLANSPITNYKFLSQLTNLKLLDGYRSTGASNFEAPLNVDWFYKDDPMFAVNRFGGKATSPCCLGTTPDTLDLERMLFSPIMWN